MQPSRFDRVLSFHQKRTNCQQNTESAFEHKMASEIHFDVYQEILDACRPFYAFDDQRQDYYGMEQNIPPRLEDGLPKSTEKTCKGDRPITPQSTLNC